MASYAPTASWMPRHGRSAARSMHHRDDIAISTSPTAAPDPSEGLSKSFMHTSPMKSLAHVSSKRQAGWLELNVMSAEAMEDSHRRSHDAAMAVWTRYWFELDNGMLYVVLCFPSLRCISLARPPLFPLPMPLLTETCYDVVCVRAWVRAHAGTGLRMSKTAIVLTQTATRWAPCHSNEWSRSAPRATTRTPSL